MLNYLRLFFFFCSINHFEFSDFLVMLCSYPLKMMTINKKNICFYIGSYVNFLMFYIFIKHLSSRMPKKFTKAINDNYVKSFENTVCMQCIFIKYEPTFLHYLNIKIYFIEALYIINSIFSYIARIQNETKICWK